MTNAADIDPDEAQRRKEFVEQLRATSIIVLEVAALLWANARTPAVAKAALVLSLIAVGLTIATILVERGVVPVP